MNRLVTIIGAIALLVVGGLIWSQLTSGDSPILSSSENEAQSSATVSALLQMRSLKLDGRLFDNPAFVSLVDTNREIIPEPVGRQNPFAPIGADDVVVTDTASQGGFQEGETFEE
jgi:hypothetical protein